MRSKALLLAAVAVATLALASPAVARPSVHSVVYPHTLAAGAMIAIACLALAVAIALVTGVVLANRPRSESAAPLELRGRVKKAPQQQAVA
jgi:hypothetical protein